MSPRHPQISTFLVSLLLLVAMGSPRTVHAQLLSPGDLAIVGVNMDDPNEISFVALVDIPQGVEIRFTNNGWMASGGFRDEEDTMVYVTPVPVPRGNVVVLNGTDGRVPGLATAGDQLFAYQVAGDGTIRFIYGLNNTPVGGWQDDAFTDQETVLPAQLLDGFTAVSLPHCDNVIYTGVSTGRQAELLLLLSQPGGWLCNNSAHFALGSHPFSVTGVLNSLPIITAALPDTTIRVGETLDFRYEATDPEGQVILFSGQDLPPGAVIALTSGVLRWSPTSSQLGPHTVRVRVSDGVSAATVSAVVTVVSGVANEVSGVPVTDIEPTVHPNPANGRIVVHHAYRADLRISDLLGRTVYDGPGTGTETRIDTGGWAHGVYMVRVTNDHGVRTVPFIVH